MHKQVSKMHIIYSEAHVTFVAAAGTDPSFGLPGINSATRPSQPHARVGEHYLTLTPRILSRELEDTVWHKRAWTFQENILSRRLLVFTKTQVHFDCARMSCCEPLDIPIEKIHTFELRRSADLMFPYSKASTHLGRGVDDGTDVSHKVQEVLNIYSKDPFSKPTDALNGVLGVLGALEDLHGLRHHHGVPILLHPSSTTTRSSLTSFVHGLSWNNSGDTYVQTRRPEFPSWSWSGWIWTTGKLQWFFPRQSEPQLDIKVELRGGRVISWK